MTYLKKIGTAFIYIFSILIVSTFIISLFNYIGLVNGKFLTILKILIPIISLFVGGFIIGRKSKSKGWLEGIKLGGIFILFLVLFNYLGLKNIPEFKTIIYYLIILGSSVIGSMFGISKNISNDWQKWFLIYNNYSQVIVW